MNEYPIDDEFWKWWNSYWKKVDISKNFCYNYNIEKKKENSKNETVEFHEYPPRLEDSTRS